jgi:siroheme synthase-like protein
VLALVQAGRVMLRQRAFQDEDVAVADLVLVCESDEELVQRASRAAAEAGAAFWANDRPELSQLAMPALVRLGRARLAISTGGAAPALASRLRACFERDLGEEFAAFVERLGVERERLLESEPDPERRRERLRALVDGFDLRITVRYPGGAGG